ncbi:MAG: hypothetical protein ACLTYI_00170 [Christensenellales bacterium]
MLPKDSIVRSIGIDSDTKYDAKSEDLIWSVLYLTGVNWGMSIEPETAEPTVTTDEQGYVTVPASTMEDYAAAAFGGDRSIPQIAASFAESVTFTDSAKAYRLAPSDMGDTIARIDSITPDGSAVKVSTGLYLGSGERLGGMVFTLEKCDTAGQFKYCVTAAVNENELGIYQWKDVKLNSEDSLSADGKADSVKFTVVQDKDGNVTVKFNINGKESTDELGPLGLDESCVHVGDTVVGDGYTELYVTGDAASDDYVTFVYRVHNGELKKAFITGTVQSVYGNGGVSRDYHRHFGYSWRRLRLYALYRRFRRRLCLRAQQRLHRSIPELLRGVGLFRPQAQPRRSEAQIGRWQHRRGQKGRKIPHNGHRYAKLRGSHGRGRHHLKDNHPGL